MVNGSKHQPGKGAWSALALLLGINLFNYLDRYVLAAVEPEIRRTFFLPGDPDAMAKTGALANVTHPSVRATAFALNIFIIHAAGDAISPPLMGWIAGRWQMNRAFLLVSTVMLLAGLLWLAGAKFLGRDTARASEGASVS